MPYTLIISEKPSAAERIAQALADDKIEKVGKKVYHFKFKHAGKDMIVVPAVGHLFVLDQKGGNKPVTIKYHYCKMLPRHATEAFWR